MKDTFFSTPQTSPLLEALKDAGVIAVCVCTVAASIAVAVDAGTTLFRYLSRR
jgi:hypothetical protein